jgi:Flp pilus assembly pilin Flp
MKKIQNFFKDEDGLETVEYAIILGLIVAGTITLITALGTWVNAQFTRVNTEVGAGTGTP